MINNEIITDTLGKEAIDFINMQITKTRLDQESIYKFVRILNKNIDLSNNLELQKSVREITMKLMESSYTDELFQNTNLSNQIKTRMPLLLEDSLMLSSEKVDTKNLENDFINELMLISTKYLESRRYLAGIGFSYSYTPKISYKGEANIDLSPYLSNPRKSVGTVFYESKFSNETTPSLALYAHIPYITISALFPKYEVSQTMVLPVTVIDSDQTSTDGMFRSTIHSKLEIDFDVNLKLSIKEVFDVKNNVRNGNQIDWGFGLGVTGYKVEDTVTTDVRFNTNDDSPYDDLASDHIIKETDHRSFNTLYFVAYYNFELTDEFIVGLDAKFYSDKIKNTAYVDVHGISAGFNVVWYPK
jgi:hypothetical protein